MSSSKIKNFVLPKLKFAGTSGVSTLLDYLVVFLLLDVMDYRAEAEVLGITLLLSNTIGTAVGMISNFILQKKYVFETRRKIWAVILLTVGFSLFAFMLNQALFEIIRTESSFFADHTFLTKIIVTGTVFVFNFYTKRLAFEKRLE